MNKNIGLTLLANKIYLSNTMVSKEKDLEQAILLEKKKGTPDIEIGRKFGVTYKYIERVITKAKGINVSGFKDLK